ncbi:DinB family protein [Mucilaginibacter jinjuensis]|uniref:DinB family protein n=1 Tax=Mucilaginibacter jinjuensis TaxID=1176721 RepID=A0ABY7T6F7_9SPHI|nr:DinB family protein [Mucilaginibacter jinjuensis]WCT11839.1 DinB family protein [Mucilaginibacter jinjuensis]
MTLLKIFSEELASEAQITRKMLERIPDDKFGWQPHPKSMTIKRLATHISDLPNWIAMALTTEELDFQNNNWEEPDLNTTAELLANLEKAVVNGENALANGKEEILDEPWVLRSGDQIFLTTKKREMIRTSLNQITHHRAQLGVFLRLLDIPIPGSYGPSADENGFA